MGCWRPKSGSQTDPNRGPPGRVLLVQPECASSVSKKQSMQWTPEGAHLLLQIHTQTLKGDLVSTSRNTYPDFSVASNLSIDSSSQPDRPREVCYAAETRAFTNEANFWEMVNGP